jgi:hypothetical protein
MPAPFRWMFQGSGAPRCGYAGRFREEPVERAGLVVQRDSVLLTAGTHHATLEPPGRVPARAPRPSDAPFDDDELTVRIE